jgi:hypothetical protein
MQGIVGPHAQQCRALRAAAAAAAVLSADCTRVMGYLQQHPGYNLEIIGHSMVSCCNCQTT